MLNKFFAIEIIEVAILKKDRDRVRQVDTRRSISSGRDLRRSRSNDPDLFCSVVFQRIGVFLFLALPSVLLNGGSAGKER